MTTTPILGMTDLTSGQSVPESTVNEHDRILEWFATGGAIEDRDQSDSASVSPSDGKAWLVAATGATDWTGKDGNIALYVNTGWLFFPPKEGMRIWVKDEDKKSTYDGSAWVDDTAGGSVSYASTADTRAGSSTTEAVTPGGLFAASAPQALTDGATIDWDMSTALNAKVTIAGNRTLNTPTNPQAGITYSLGVIQDGTGSRTMTWPASFDWGATGAPTLTTTASKRDRITLFCTDAATPKFDAFLSGKGFS